MKELSTVGTGGADSALALAQEVLDEYTPLTQLAASSRLGRDVITRVRDSVVRKEDFVRGKGM